MSKTEQLSTNDRSMILLAGDAFDCQPYAGAFQGTHFYIVGYGTEWEKIFLRQNKSNAIAYANERGVKMANLVSARSLCADRVLAALGA